MAASQNNLGGGGLNYVGPLREPPRAGFLTRFLIDVRRRNGPTSPSLISIAAGRRVPTRSL